MRLWRLIAREPVNFLVIVGDAFARPLVEALDQLDPMPDLSSLTRGPLRRRDPLARGEGGWVEALPATLLIDGFGASEIGWPGSERGRRGRLDRRRRPFRVNDETTVLDDDLRPAAVGVVGKLARRGHVPARLLQGPREDRPRRSP